MAAKQTKPNTKQKTDEIKVNFCMLADALRLKNSYQEAGKFAHAARCGSDEFN